MPITNLSYVTVTGTFKNLLTGNASTGSVRFTMSGRIVNTTSNEIVVPQDFTAPLVNGSLSISLPATDDPDFIPTGRYWEVTEFIDGTSRTYAILLPAAFTPVDLADIAPIDPTDPAAVYELAGADAPSTSKRFAQVVIGAAAAGYTTADVDFLAIDGSAEDAFNQAWLAITDVPPADIPPGFPGGTGSILVLPGVYRCSDGGQIDWANGNANQVDVYGPVPSDPWGQGTMILGNVDTLPFITCSDVFLVNVAVQNLGNGPAVSGGVGIGYELELHDSFIESVGGIGVERFSHVTMIGRGAIIGGTIGISACAAISAVGQSNGGQIDAGYTYSDDCRIWGNSGGGTAITGFTFCFFSHGVAIQGDIFANRSSGVGGSYFFATECSIAGNIHNIGELHVELERCYYVGQGSLPAIFTTEAGSPSFGAVWVHLLNNQMLVGGPNASLGKFHKDDSFPSGGQPQAEGLIKGNVIRRGSSSTVPLIELADADQAVLDNQIYDPSSGNISIRASGDNDLIAGNEFFANSGQTDIDIPGGVTAAAIRNNTGRDTGRSPFVTDAGTGTIYDPSGGGGISALTGDVTAAGSGSVAATIAGHAVTNAKAAQMAAHTFKGNNTGSTADALDLTVSQMQTELGTSGANTGDVTIAAFGSTPTANAATLSGQALTLQPADGTHPGSLTSGAQTIGGAKTFSGAISASNLSGSNTGDQTITLTGNVTGTGTGSFATTIAPHVVTAAMQSQMAAHTMRGNNTGSTADVIDLTLAQVKTELNLTGTNSGDQTITLTGDVTGSGTGSFPATLATVNSNVGSFGSATQAGTFTVNGKGLVTAASNTTIAIPESAVTNLVSDLALKAPLASPALTGVPTAPTAAQGTSTTQVATTAMVASEVSVLNASIASAIAGLDDLDICNFATSAALPSCTYANGTAGVGATLTATAPGILTIDSTGVPISGSSILVQNQASAFQNGVYTLTTVGTAIVAFVLTRRTDFDQGAEMSVPKMVPVNAEGLTAGSSNDNKTFLSITSSPFTVGTTGITFGLIGSTYSADNSTLQLSGTTFSEKDGGTTNAKLADMAAATFKMRAAGAGTGVPIDGTAAQAKTALAIANTDVSGLGTLSTQNGTFSGTHSGTSSGTNTGDQTITLTGDATGSGTGSFATTLATVNGSPGSFGSASTSLSATVNGKGLVTALSSQAIQIAESQVTSLTTDLAGKAKLLLATAVKTSAYSAASGDFVPLDTTSATFAVTLPTAPADGTSIIVKWVAPSNGANSPTVVTGGSDVFNLSGGATTATFAAVNETLSFTYKATGAIWYIETGFSKGGLDTIYAPLASPALTGTPTAPTAAQGTNTTQLATTAMVQSEVTLLAPKASPALTGNPTATTQTAGNNSTRLATTAYADALVSDTAYAGSWDAVTGIAPSKNAVYDQVQLLAPLASPTFTGTPAAPTAAQGTNTTQVATTAMVHSEAVLLAPLASPTFTGNPLAPTPAAGDNDTSIATTAFVTTAALRGVGTPQTAKQSLSASTRGLITGTSYAVPTGSLVANVTWFRFRIMLDKTAAGTATWSAIVAWGTANTTSDAAIATFTSGTNTAQATVGELVIDVPILTTGAAATAGCMAVMTQSGGGITTGLGGFMGAPGSTATFDSTLTNPFIHVDITPGASAVMTGFGTVQIMR